MLVPSYVIYQRIKKTRKKENHPPEKTLRLSKKTQKTLIGTLKKKKKVIDLHPAKTTVPNMLSSTEKTTFVPLLAEAEILRILIATFSPSRWIRGQCVLPICADNTLS